MNKIINFPTYQVKKILNRAHILEISFTEMIRRIVDHYFSNLPEESDPIFKQEKNTKKTGDSTSNIKR